MLIDDFRICQALRRIVTRLSADPALQQDLMQECLIHLWKLEASEPGRTRSWYLQNCRFHLQHWLASGRSLDSLKRAHADNRVSIDSVNDGFHPDEAALGNGELVGLVSARDIIAALARRLKPCESALLGGLADGMVLNDIAAKLKLSYPTALKYRRKIAALTVKLGIPPPRPYKKDVPVRLRRPAAGHPLPAEGSANGVDRCRPAPERFRAGRPGGTGPDTAPFPKICKPVIDLRDLAAGPRRGRNPSRPALEDAR